MEFSIKAFSLKTANDIDLSFLPPMARRKLSNLDKIALSVMNECLCKSNIKNPETLKTVFASQYAEIGRLKKLIAQYTSENEVSPATFSASVHNNAAGQFSLLNQLKESYNSISAEKDTFIAGLTESIITKEDVLYCFAEEEPETIGCAFLISHENPKFQLITNKNPLICEKNSDVEGFTKFITDLSSKEFTSQNGLFTISRISQNLEKGVL